jgi:hypothetical protein
VRPHIKLLEGWNEIQRRATADFARDVPIRNTQLNLVRRVDLA